MARRKLDQLNRVRDLGELRTLAPRFSGDRQFFAKGFPSLLDAARGREGGGDGV